MADSQIAENATKRALLAIKQLQSKIEVLEYARSEPIAIVGMACRFPAGADSPEKFWEILCSGVDATVDIPESRWPSAAFYDPDPETPGHLYARRASLLDRVDGFDADFFGISPREAEMLDPQQRLLLEVTWEALERAGIPAARLQNSRTGIFIGSEHHDYLHLAFYPLSGMNIYTGTGNMPSLDSGRLAYFLGTQGPTLTIDTACSASLVAIHSAVQSLRTGECELALSGGVNLILAPHMSIIGSRAQALAPDGRSKAFSAAADGYGRGEGCGVLVLKRLSDAVKACDRILAVIRGSAVNHDGRSSGLTVPSGPSQQKLIREALANAKIEADQVGYIETHGTGTILGDPIELEALNEVFGNRPEALIIGSVKTNIGHLEAAAGVASVIKTVLAIQRGRIPPHLHFDKPNPHIAWENFSLKVPTTLCSWPAGPRVAGVSSFSLSGTNSHVLISEAPPVSRCSSEPELRPGLLTLSAKSEAALREMAKNYAEHLEKIAGKNEDEVRALNDLCFTSQTGRTHFDHRLSVTAKTLEQTRTALNEFGEGATPLEMNHRFTDTGPCRIAFLFTGQGSQYAQMGRGLYENEPILRKTLEHCDEILLPLLQISVIDLLYPKDPKDDRLDQTAYTQPALFALEYALAQLWFSWGIRPEIMLGHSVGEYVAACLAGVFCLEDGLRLIAARGRLMQDLPREGAMIAVAADESLVAKAVQAYAQEVAIAALNGPQNVVVSGRTERVEALAAAFRENGIRTTRLTVSHAFHSPLMESMLGDFEHIARTIRYAAPQRELVSNLSGEAASSEIATPAYWCRHLRHAVQFAKGIHTVFRRGCRVFLEIGPKPTLLAMGRQCLESGAADDALLWLPSLRPGQEDEQTLMSTLGQLYVHAATIDWAKVHEGRFCRKVILPTYPFQRRSFWIRRHASGYSASPSSRTPLIALLEQGDAGQLAAVLEQDGNFSEDERKLLPKVAQSLIREQARQNGDQEQHEFRKFCAIDWREMPRSERDLPLLPEGRWLVLADRAGVGTALAELLRGHDGICDLAYAGEQFGHQGKDWVLNPTRPEDFRRLLAETVQSEALRSVVYLWALDSSGTEVESAQTLCCGALHLLQALQQSGSHPKLWFATRGATNITGEREIAVAQGSLWGLARVLVLESPGLWGGIIDLDPRPDSSEPHVCFQAAATLFTEIWDPQGEDQLAFRGEGRYAARLVEKHVPASLPMRAGIRGDASYLITGGFGALGIQLAQWLIKQGAKNLVLVGRRGSEGKQEQIKALGEQARILVLKADVSQAEDLSLLLSEIESALPPLRGIFHAAGVIDDGILRHQNWQRFQKVMAPKAIGGWNLYTQTRSLPLDFLVFFSSAAGLLGSAGQANYAAANAFLDALAAHVRTQGLLALSICWGSWAGAGMGKQSTARGERALRPSQAFGHLQNLLENLPGRTDACVGVVDIDWPVFASSFQTSPPFLSELVETTANSEADILSRMAEVSAGERRELLRTYLKTEVARVLGAEELPEGRRGFFDLGLDSLMAQQLGNRLQTGLKIVFPSTLVYEYPSVDALTDYLLEHEFPLDDSSAIEADAFDEDLTTVSDLTESELEAMIDREISEFEALRS
ncbi:MAG: type I polyketide synthase [Gammaproteobacteria bacterium]